MGKNKKNITMMMPEKTVFLSLLCFQCIFFCHGCMFIVFPAVIRMEYCYTHFYKSSSLNTLSGPGRREEGKQHECTLRGDSFHSVLTYT